MKKLKLIMIALILGVVQGCGANPETYRAIANASCSLSMNCNPAYQGSSYNAPSSGLYNGLTRSYISRGDQMCAYEDGTVINIGIGICPLSR